jgi:hypothetical protein
MSQAASCSWTAGRGPGCASRAAKGTRPGELAAGADLNGGLPRVRLPDMSGIAVWARLRAIEPGILVVAWSGEAAPPRCPGA